MCDISVDVSPCRDGALVGKKGVGIELLLRPFGVCLKGLVYYTVIHMFATFEVFLES